MEINLRCVDGGWIASFRVGNVLTEKLFTSWGVCSTWMEKWIKDNNAVQK